MRAIIAIIPGFIVAIALFFVMRGFIHGKTMTVPQDSDSTSLVSFVAAPKKTQLRHKQRRKPEKMKQAKPKAAAPKVKIAQQQHQVQTPRVNINVPNIQGVAPGAGGAGPYLGGFNVSNLGANGQAIPIVAIKPRYPTRAMLHKIEGYVTLEFTIEPDGSASNPKVIASQPRGVFNRAARTALLRSKFKPQVIDGKPKPSRATFTYQFNVPKSAK